MARFGNFNAERAFWRRRQTYSLLLQSWFLLWYKRDHGIAQQRTVAKHRVCWLRMEKTGFTEAARCVFRTRSGVSHLPDHRSWRAELAPVSLRLARCPAGFQLSS